MFGKVYSNVIPSIVLNFQATYSFECFRLYKLSPGVKILSVKDAAK